MQKRLRCQDRLRTGIGNRCCSVEQEAGVPAAPVYDIAEMVLKQTVFSQLFSPFSLSLS